MTRRMLRGINTILGKEWTMRDRDEEDLHSGEVTIELDLAPGVQYDVDWDPERDDLIIQYWRDE